MSTSKGSNARKRPQKHQNRTAFKNDLHDTSGRTKFINSLEVSGVCKRCKEIIEWKIKYKKYKPLTAPTKCVNCGEKAVRHAYHVLCKKCAAEKKVCAKCCKPADNNEEDLIHNDGESNQDAELQAMLKTLPERKRRTVLRYLEKSEQKLTPEVKALIEEVMAGVNKVNLDDDLDFLNEEFEDSDDGE